MIRSNSENLLWLLWSRTEAGLLLSPLPRARQTAWTQTRLLGFGFLLWLLGSHEGFPEGIARLLVNLLRVHDDRPDHPASLLFGAAARLAGTLESRTGKNRVFLLAIDVNLQSLALSRALLFSE